MDAFVVGGGDLCRSEPENGGSGTERLTHTATCLHQMAWQTAELGFLPKYGIFPFGVSQLTAPNIHRGPSQGRQRVQW
jgi:hypothetical protein